MPRASPDVTTGQDQASSTRGCHREAGAGGLAYIQARVEERSTWKLPHRQTFFTDAEGKSHSHANDSASRTRRPRFSSAADQWEDRLRSSGSPAP